MFAGLLKTPFGKKLFKNIYIAKKWKNEKKLLKYVVNTNVLNNIQKTTKNKKLDKFSKKSIRLRIIPDIIFQRFGIPEKKKKKWKNTGFILSITDGVALITSLKKVSAGELVKFPGVAKTKGLVMSLLTNIISVLILATDNCLGIGDRVKRTGKIASISNSGWFFLNRVVDGLGNAVDGKGTIKTLNKKVNKIDIKAPGIVERSSVREPLITGIKSVDSMIPIGRGQRELIIGDRQTGKTSLIIDTIISQKLKKNALIKLERVFCVYVIIGQKKSTVMSILRILRFFKTLSYTTLVVASAAESAALQYLAPYTGSTIAEFFRNNKRHSLIIHDDLSKQAVSYRQISLLLRRPPGREAYPGDIFYLHSRLLERAAKLSKKLGNGSLTALPVVETQEGDVSAYIPTNVISITDGQIFLEKELFNKGILPAVNVGLSVSRVGSAAQIKSMKKYAGSLKLELAQFREVEAFLSFASDLDENTLKTINRGQRWVELLKQKKFKPLPIELQTLLIFGGWSGLYDTINKKDIINFVENVINFWTTLSLEYSNNFGGLLSEQFFKHVIDSVKKNATYGNIRKK